MKVVLISTFDLNGGASIAAYRHLQSLIHSGIDAKLLVASKESTDTHVIEANAFPGRKRLKINLAAEKLRFYFHEKSPELRFAFSTADFGYPLDEHPAVMEADIIHIHWALQGFLSLKTLQKFQSLSKPVFWTLHDMWAFTGGCHYAGECTGFQHACGHCPLLKRASDNDLSHQQVIEKASVYKNIRFVTCSRWLMEVAQKSSLLKNAEVCSIPNPIDINDYHPAKDKTALKVDLGLNPQKKYLLFGATKISEERKGLKFMLEALEILTKDAWFMEHTGLIVYGNTTDFNFHHSGYDLQLTGYLQQHALKRYYQASEVYVIPSLEDNLPNTVMESLACGLPVAGFNTGGIPEMVDHLSNGYIAEQRNAGDLAAGILWILKHPEWELLSESAVNKVATCYDASVIAGKFREIYQLQLDSLHKH